ncbi:MULTISPECIES: galactonate dehydratase [Halorussus]|uniref:galactonate dehydratase n=1 Tax=Halorussus TaxID=1070314 RepID=UPI000E214EC9|nr:MULTISPECIES: galactonate dehydratase [Halorussus]NHN61674.1 galactonate dehydratase [Halorussus sp. JP-T4]
MEITKLETHLVGNETDHAVDRWLFVRIHTDEGIVGTGEAGAWGYLEPCERAMETFGRYLVGKDPLRRDHHWQYLYRNAHFRGAVLMGALSAIDVALWDIAGKHFGVPVYQLLGGQCRDTARAYVHAFGETTEELAAECRAAKEAGFTAVGHLSPLLDEPREEPYFETHAGMITDAVDRVRTYREAVGNDVDLCIEIHRRLDPEQAIPLAKEIAQFHPFFYEDPVRPDNFDAMAKVADDIDVPIATGERLHTPYEFNMLLRRDAVQFVRPNLGLAGGFSQVKKIAGLAEANHVDVVPHNPLSPVSTAAGLQLAASIPNFGLQEFPFRPSKGEAPGEHLIESSLEWEDGYLRIPDEPGLGITVDEEALTEHGHEPRELVTRLHEDGSVVDQ